MANSNVQTVVDTDSRKLLPDEEMGRLVDIRYTAAKNARTGKEDQWKRWYNLYRSYAERKNWGGVSLFIPLIYSTIESFIPRMVTERPKLVVEGRGDEDIPSARYHRMMMEYQWDLLGMSMILMDWVKESLIYGTGIVKCNWLETSREHTFRNTLDPTGEPSTTTVNESRPDIRVVPLERFYVSPGARSMDDATYVIERHRWTWEHMDVLASMGFLDQAAVDKVKLVRDQAEADASDTDLEAERIAQFGGNDPRHGEKEALIYRFDVIEYWEDNRYCFYIPAMQIVLKNAMNPFWHGKKPYIRIVDNALPGEFYGVGEAEVLQSIQIELNEIHNLRLEAAKRAVLQMWKVRIGSPVTPNMLKFKHQGIVWCADPSNDVVPLFPGNPQGPSYREEDVLSRWAQQTSGATDPFQGLDGGGGGDTATGASILAQAAASRVGMKFLILSEMGLRPLGRMLIALNEQHITDETAIRITGQAGAAKVDIGPKELATGGAILDVKIDIGSTDPINRELALQKATNLLNVVGSLYGPNHPATQVIILRIMELSDIDLPPEMLKVPAPEANQGGAPSPINQGGGGGQGGSDPLAPAGGGSPSPVGQVAEALTAQP